MAKVSEPTTGFINNGGLVQLGANNTSGQWDYITLAAPSAPWRILVEGDLPTTSTTPNMSVTVFEGTTPLFSASGTWQTQGQSSQGALKQNWKLKLKNSSTGNKLSLRIGDWFPMTSVTLKGYGTDRTLVRDSLTTAIWREMRKNPSGLLAPLSAYQYFDGTDLGTHTSALFTTAGFPAELWQNGTFLGMYVLRSPADLPDYLMDDSNNQHILIQPQHAGNIWEGTFTSTEWTVQSPAISGYDDQDDISTSAPDINAACSRIVKWFGDCVAGNVDARATYPQYIDLQSFLDYVLICELAGSYDSMQNNFELGSWNATSTSGIWSVWLYDCDETWGLIIGLGGAKSDAENIGWVMENPNGYGWQSPGFFKLMHTIFRPELRARWAQLRQAGIIDAARIKRWIAEYVVLIDPTIMQQDLENWKLTGATGSIDVSMNIEKESVSYIMNYAQTRIAWIDAQWGYSGA